MFDDLTRDESLLAIREKVTSINSIRMDKNIVTTEKSKQTSILENEIRELWYHIYDLEGKPYER